MPTQKIKNRVFLNIANSLTELETSPKTQLELAIAVIDRPRIQQWFNDNKIRVMSIYDRINRLRHEFFEYEENTEGGEKKVKMFTPASIPAVPAKYETKKVPTKWYQKKKFEQVKIADEVPEKTFAPEPVCLEGKTLKEFNSRLAEIMDEESDMKY